MTMQVVIFSVMLFGMSGVILDFGRIYDEHSGMQSFTDQAALAAAKELNGQADSLQRAIDAVYDSNGDTLIAKISDHAYAYETNAQGDQVRVDVPYKISGLYFLRSFSDDGADKQYSLGDNLRGGNLLYTATPHADDRTVGSEHAAASYEAKYVVAVAEEISVRNSLMQILNVSSSGGATATQSVEADQTLRTVSVAKNKRVSCGDFSNLVICNPWEGRTRSMNEALSDPSNVGIQFHFRADGFLAQDGSPTTANSLLRRLNLEGADAVVDICHDFNRLPGYQMGMTQTQIELLQTVCMMSAAVTSDDGICVDEKLEVTAAEPEVVTTALNTTFDMWDWPISEVLTWDQDANGYHSQERDEDDILLHDPATVNPMNVASILFQPALNIMKGRIWREDVAMVNRALGIPDSSRLNYPRSASTGYFELITNRCIRQGHAAYGTQCLTDVDGDEFTFEDTDSTTRAYISRPTTWPDVYEYYFTNFDAHFQGSGYMPPDASLVDTYAEASELETSEWLNNNGGTFFAYGASVFTYEQGDSLTHSGEDASLDTHLASPNTSIEQIEVQRCRAEVGSGVGDLTKVDGTGRCIPGGGNSDDDETVLARDSIDRERAYTNYTYRDLANPAFSYSNDRRRLNVTVVNCGSAEVNDEGDASMEVEGFAQMYLLSPPRVTCPDGSETCVNSQISYADVYGEFTELIVPDNHSFAVLVR